MVTHDREVIPVTRNGGSYSPGVKGSPLQWDGESVTYGKLNRLGLSGDFLIKLEFDEEELKSWLKQYVNKKPDEAIRLLAAMQAEAILKLHAADEPA